MFPPANIWNVPVNRMPVDARSQDYIGFVAADRYLHADFGPSAGIPYMVVDSGQARASIRFTEFGSESDPGPYPIPPDAPIEQSGDRHVLVLDRGDCKLYELFNAFPQPDGSWHASSGAVFDLRSHKLRPNEWTSTDAAGLPVLPGLVRYEEIEAGEIRHAIRLTLRQTRRAMVWPARHFASSSTDMRRPPMGQRFRLKADVDISGFSATNQVILRALKKYGMILADNGSDWFITGAPDPRWDNADLNRLHQLRTADFEAVDTSPLMADPDSGRVKSAVETVVNGASFLNGPVSPGQIVSLFGLSLGPEGPDEPMPEVLIDGKSAPVIYAGPGQVNAVVPYSVAGRSSVPVVVKFAGTSEPLEVPVAEASPGIFAVVNSDGKLNSEQTPAKAGSWVVIWATGEGLTDPPGVDGRVLSETAPLPRPLLPVTVDGGEILYAGGAPNFIAGLMQVNVAVQRTGPLVLRVGQYQSQPGLTLWVQ